MHWINAKRLLIGSKFRAKQFIGIVATIFFFIILISYQTPIAEHEEPPLQEVR